MKKDPKQAQDKMQSVVDSLLIPLSVAWVPQPDRENHAEIEESSRTLFLYDVSEQAAWQSLFHEVVEWKLRLLTQAYRLTLNALIEAIEKIVYARKEEFIAFLPRIYESISKRDLDE